MGFNIAGIAAGKNLENNIAEIEQSIGYKLELIEKIDFETASRNWKDNEFCDIYFGKNGTLIFLSHELSIEPYSIMDLPTLTYAMSETAMTFCFHYYNKGEFVRSLMEAEGNELRSDGTPLEFESSPVDCSSLIWELIDKTIDGKYFAIDLEEPSYRYRLKKNVM